MCSSDLTLSWAPASGASGYIVRLMNLTTTLTQRSWVDSGFTSCSATTCSWTPSVNLDTDGSLNSKTSIPWSGR